MSLLSRVSEERAMPTVCPKCGSKGKFVYGGGEIHCAECRARVEQASLLGRVLCEALNTDDQQLADNIVNASRRDPNNEMWREVRHRLHGHPAGIPGVEQYGIDESKVPDGATCETCRRAGRGAAPATTMRKGMWGVWSYLCPDCAGKRDGVNEAKQTTADLILDAIAELSDRRTTIGADELAKQIGRSRITVIKVASKLAARGKINRLPSLDRYSRLAEELAEEREMNADGSMTCGVFLPVPYNLARLFPDKSEHDGSVPHYTLLFAGDLSPDQHTALVHVAQRVAREHEPFALTMAGYQEFTNNDGQTIPHMGAKQDLGELHADLRKAAEAAGLPIAHTYGPEENGRPYAEQFKTHATLAYVDKDEPPYSGPKPTGTWKVTELEVWGHENYRVPMGKLSIDQPIGESEMLFERVVTEAKATLIGGKLYKNVPPTYIDDPNQPGVQVPNPAFKTFFMSLPKTVQAAMGKKKGKKSAKPTGTPDEEAAKKAAQKKVISVSKKLTGLKSIQVKIAKVSHKGFDFEFKGGGRVKIRPRSDGSITVKLQGIPKPHYRYRGDGPSLDQALAGMKPEKKGKHGATTDAIAAISKGMSPAVKPEKKGKKGSKPKASPGPASENVNGVTLFNDMGVDQTVWDLYAMSLKHSVDLLKKAGFGFMLGKFTMHLRKGTGGAYGNYDMRNKTVEIFVPVLGYKAKRASIMLTMVHEMGHHYYYREIPRPKRKEYRWYFDKAKATKGDFATSYGATKRYEDFAEIFAAFFGRGHQMGSKKSYLLTPDIMQRFRTFLAFDKRIKLHEDEGELEVPGRRPLWTLGEQGVFCESCACEHDEEDDE